MDGLTRVELEMEASAIDVTPRTIDQALALLRRIKALKASVTEEEGAPVKEHHQVWREAKDKLNAAILSLSEREADLRKKVGVCVVDHNLTKDDISTPGITFRSDWDVVIDDPELVPRNHCSPDEKKLKKLAKTMKGHAVVPGARFIRKIVINVKEDAGG